MTISRSKKLFYEMLMRGLNPLVSGLCFCGAHQFFLNNHAFCGEATPPHYSCQSRQRDLVDFCD
jgi:hypothetical protein